MSSSRSAIKRLEYWPSLWNNGDDRPIIHIDATPANIEPDYSPAVELIGNIAETVTKPPPLLRRPQLARAIGQ